MLNSHISLILVTVLLLPLFTVDGIAKSRNDGKEEETCKCNYWFWRVGALDKAPFPSRMKNGETNKRADNPQDFSFLTEMDTKDENIMISIECLLSLQGNSKRARFGGAARMDVSTIIEVGPVEVAALYYISYLFYQKWDHAEGIVLLDSNGNRNTKKAIRKAYKYYRVWFAKVKSIGLQKAREMNLDPLENKDVMWY